MKKQILTFVALATIAVGAAVTSTAQSAKTNTIDARIGPSAGSCETSVPCHITEDIPDCEFEEVTYIGKNPSTGVCDQPLALD